jgi:selenocysteine lyase
MQMSSCKAHIVTTNVEHDAILLPLKHFEEEQQAGKSKILNIL